MFALSALVKIHHVEILLMPAHPLTDPANAGEINVKEKMGVLSLSD